MGTSRSTSVTVGHAQRAALAALAALVIALLVACGAAPSITPAEVTATAAAQATAAAAGALATVNAQITATAAAFTAQLNQAHVIYHAPVPGPGCDPAGAAYSTAMPQNVTCLPAAMRLTGSSNTSQPVLTAVLCKIPVSYPAHYILAVDVSAPQGNTIVQFGAFDFGAPHDVFLAAGSLQVLGPDQQPIIQAALPATGTIHVMIVVTGQQVIYVINGAPVGSYPGQPAQIQTIAFEVESAGSGSAVQADFSNFTVSAFP